MAYEPLRSHKVQGHGENPEQRKGSSSQNYTTIFPGLEYIHQSKILI